MTKWIISLFTMLASLSLIPSVHAHYVWLERDGDGPARAYLGEWINDVREKTGGMLDRIKAPRVFLGVSTEPLPVKRNENNLEFQVKGRGDLRLVENSMPVERLTPHMVRVVFAGQELEGFTTRGPAEHLKVNFPPPGEAKLVLPEWGAEGPILLEGQQRPLNRTYTPRRWDRETGELTVDFLLHGEGPGCWRTAGSAT